MNIFIKIISAIGLSLTLLPSIFVFGGQISLETCKILMITGTFIWFISAPRWINKNS